MPLLDRLVAESPASAEVFALRAHAYAHLDRPTDAVADGERAVKLGPRVAEAYLRRGEAKSANGKMAEALADYATSIKLNPKDHEAWGNQAWAYNVTGEYQKAIDSATQALAIRNDRYDSWAVRGGAYLQLNNHKAAITDLSQAITRRPGEADLFMGRAAAYLATQQYELALSDANQTLRLRPDYPDALVTRAAIYMALNRNDAARQDLTYALQLRPGMSDASNLLGSLDKRNAAAPPAILPSAAGAPSAPGGSSGDAAVGYARLLDQTSAAFSGGRFAEAGALVDQMIRLDPSRPDAWGLRGAMLVGANNLPAAQEAYINALARGGTVYFRLVHDHAGAVGCVGAVGLNSSGISFAGENGGHQLQWPLSSITEISLNPFYGIAIGMFHLRAQGARGVETFNFSVVRLNDVQLLNRRPEAELFIGLVNQVKQASLR
jgi:tetratricopeptide (TPR) repeat protein